MRVGIVTGEYPPMVGGVGAYSRILATEMARQGHAISVFNSTGIQNIIDTTKPFPPHSDVAESSPTGSKTWGIGRLWAARQWARNERLDIVNLQFQTAAFGMSPWIHFLPEFIGRAPVVTTFHDLRHPYLFPKAGRWRDWIVMRLARTSAGVIATNHEDQMRLRTVSKVTLIPIGSNILTAMPADYDVRYWRERASAQDDTFLLGYFGLFNRSKGLHHLIDSVAQLRATDVPVKLVLIGGGAGTSDPTNTGFIAELNRQIDEHKLGPVVHQTGYEDDETVGAYLSGCDALALPFTDGASYRRGSLMAAIRYGCAIITTTPRVSIPTFRDSENMLLVKAGDSPALEAGIRRLYERPDLRERLKRGAAELAHEFEWEEIAQATTDFFKWVIEENQA